MEEQGGGSFPLTPTQGTYIIGLSNAIPAMAAILTIQVLGRRTIYITGQFFMSVFLVLCGVSALEGWNLMTFISLCLLITCYHLSQGSVAWLYIPEVTVDAASGFSTGAQFINLVLISFTFEYMINSPMKIHGSIWYFGGLTFLGFIFCLFFVRETRGLNDLEKKTLYSPKSVDVDITGSDGGQVELQNQ